MNRDAAELAWDLHDARSQVLGLQTDIGATRPPSYPHELASARARLLHLTDECLDQLRRARDYAAMIGWSRALDGNPGLAMHVAEALDQRMRRLAFCATTVDVELAGAHRTSLEAARQGRSDARYHSQCMVFAREIDQARARFARGPAVDLRAGDVRSIVQALTAEAQRQAAVSPDGFIPSKLCRRILAASISLLPLQHRTRYDEEFRAELYDVGPARQLVHVLRLFVNCWQLRRELERPPY